MNLGEIKAFMGEQKASVNEQKAAEDPNKAVQKQLQQDGLRQAAEFQQRQASMVSVSSSQLSISLKVYSTSMEQSVSIDGQHGRFGKRDDVKGEKKQESLFDFEEVAKNVMKFVGGVIQGAAKGGADDEKLNSLFSQAREGVARGIEMAEKEIGGLMNDEIAEGISRSRDLIEERLGELEQKLLGKTSENEALTGVAASTSVSSTNAASGNLTIRTRDGDELQISFESLRQFQYERQQGYSSVSRGGNGGGESQQSGFQATESTSYSYFDRQGISFSLKGELDEDEMTAIADLIEQVNDLADTFFGGDLDKAFEKALELGFDDQELTGYALQLNRVQQTEVVKTYGAIQHYRENDTASGHGDEAKPIAQYLEKMLNVFDSARQQLESGEDFNTLINGLINEMKDVQVPDLISAINRFHAFNQRLLDSMPGERETIQPADRQSIQPDGPLGSEGRESIQPADPLNSGGRETIQPVAPESKDE